MSADTFLVDCHELVRDDALGMQRFYKPDFVAAVAKYQLLDSSQRADYIAENSEVVYWQCSVRSHLFFLPFVYLSDASS